MRGVAAGASTPYQVVTSKSASPASATVGTSGRALERCGATSASARSLPALMCGAAAGMPMNTRCTLPLSTSCIARFTPLYGMCTRLVPATRLKSSPARWFEVPAPPEPKLSAPGLAFTVAINSFKSPGMEGCVIITFGTVATRLIGARSFTGS